MKKQAALWIAVVTLLSAAAGPQTFTGVITDNMCDKANHKDMDMGPPDAKCVTECVRSMGGKYALFDGKKAYLLSDQKTPEQFAARKVAVTGTLDAATNTIRVDRISPVR